MNINKSNINNLSLKINLEKKNNLLINILNNKININDIMKNKMEKKNSKLLKELENDENINYLNFNDSLCYINILNKFLDNANTLDHLNKISINKLKIFNIIENC